MANIKVKIITDFEKRTRTWFGVGISENNQICEIFLHEDRTSELQGFVMITKAIIKYSDMITISLSENSKIYKTADFVIDTGVVNAYLHAPVVTIAEALTTSRTIRNRRISLRGTVVDVTPVITGPTWRRKDLYVTEGGYSIQVKLWGERSAVDISRGERWKFENLSIKFFDSARGLKISAETTSTTNLEEIFDQNQENGSKIIKVEGLMKTGTMVEIVDEIGNEYRVASNIWPEAITAKDLPCVITLQFQDGVIVETLVGSDAEKVEELVKKKNS